MNDSENIIITKEQLSAYLEKILSDNPVLFDELENLLDFLSPLCSFDLREFVFRIAVRCGAVYYVEEHMDGIELNDVDGHSTYLNECEDEEMQDILMSGGAFRSFEDYSDCRFAMETVNGEILAFDKRFQRRVFEAYMTENELNEKLLIGLLEARGGFDDLDIEIEDVLDAMGVAVTANGISFSDKVGDDGYALKDVIEDLGWMCDFEGDSWKLETVGVYFIK